MGEIFTEQQGIITALRIEHMITLATAAWRNAACLTSSSSSTNNIVSVPFFKSAGACLFTSVVEYSSVAGK